jgi:hypothetical protein
MAFRLVLTEPHGTGNGFLAGGGGNVQRHLDHVDAGIAALGTADDPPHAPGRWLVGRVPGIVLAGVPVFLLNPPAPNVATTTGQQLFRVTTEWFFHSPTDGVYKRPNHAMPALLATVPNRHPR